MFYRHSHHRSYFSHNAIVILMLLMAFLVGRASRQKGCLISDFVRTLKCSYSKNNQDLKPDPLSDVPDENNNIMVGEGVR